jgi:hypothetical protein
MDLVYHQNIVAVKTPTPIQSTKITYKRKLTNCQNLSFNTIAKPIEVMQSQAANNTKNAGSSLANCDLVSVTSNFIVAL